MLKHGYSGTSLRDFEHVVGRLGEQPDNGVFMFNRYDFGKERNLVEYGSEVAGYWDLTKLKNLDSKIVLVIPKKSSPWISDQGIEFLVNQIFEQGKKRVYWVDGWGHTSFTLAKNLGEILFPILDKELNY